MSAQPVSTDVKTPVKLRFMAPNAPKTPISNFRIPLELKQKAQAKAVEQGKTLTDVIVDYLKRYTR